MQKFNLKQLLSRVFHYFWNWRDFQPQTSEESVCLDSKLRTGVKYRLVLPLLIFGFLLGFLVCHLYNLQIVRHQEICKKSAPLYTRSSKMTSYRGRIMDKSGNILAVDQPSMDFFCEPKRFASKREEAVNILCRHLEMSRKDVERILDKGLSRELSLVVARDIPLEQADGLRKYCGGSLVLYRQNSPEGTPACVLKYYPGKESKEERQKTMSVLCNQLGLIPSELSAQVNRTLGRFAEVPLRKNVPLEQARAAINELKARKIEGVRTIDSSRRMYPRGSMLANMLGFLDADGGGVSGIEGLMDKVLKPQAGKVTFTRDRLGRPVDLGEIIVQEPQNGADIFLTIEEPLQLIAEEELATLVAEKHPVRAYALMMNPATGAIMALAQYPSFNPNERTTLTDPSRTANHILVQAYDPGSVMKPLSISGALENRVVNIDSRFDCEQGSMYYGGKVLHDTHHYGMLSVAEIIQKSSNIGTAKIALQMGDRMVFETLDSYLFGRPTRLGFHPANSQSRVFGNEAKGSFRKLANWDTLTVTRTPIGQGISCTILQLAQAWCALVNGGTMMQPYIIDRVVYPDGQSVSSVPKEKNHVLSPETEEIIRDALVTVTQKGGTGTLAHVPGYRVAGKTGTSQLWIPGDKAKGIVGHYADKYCLASFVGYAPADSPRFLLIVSSEGASCYPRTGGYVSGPTFRRIAARALEYLQVPPDDLEEYNLAKAKEEQKYQQELKNRRRLEQMRNQNLATAR
ncbi:MAG: penicillin-binding protein 2 [Victivallales bacterium]|nr:penicillin-binding protein 2 [Victivallales bacterium]